MKKIETVIGFHAIETILQTRPQDMVSLRYLDHKKNDKRVVALMQLAMEKNIIIQPISFDNIPNDLKQSNHQGVIAECYELSQWDENDLIDAVKKAEKPVVLLVLDEVQDPHNLGACMRSANAFGVMAVIAPKDNAAKITDVVRKVSSGASDQTPYVMVTNLSRTIKALQDCGVWFVGLEGSAESSLSSIDLTMSIGIVMGNEAKGLRRLTKENCDYLAYIPMQGTVESLNVSVATGIALYEARRQSVK